MAFQTPVCQDETRRAALGGSAFNGIDYLEVSASGTTLRIFFQKELPLNAYGLPGSPGNLTIQGGVRIRNIQVTQVRRADAFLLEADVSAVGDFSTYTLVINSASLDPVYSQVDFVFRPGCASRFDCKGQPCPTEPVVNPLIDYYAKDYLSFRQALLDLVALKIPGWTERHEADIGIALIDLLSYAGDQLSYYQDSVANEAYLETARQRISIRRHARLVDYHMHDGVSARTFVHFQLRSGTAGTIPADTPVLARIDVPLSASFPPFGPVLPAALGDLATAATTAVFETMWPVNLDSRLNQISIYTWDDQLCCVPQSSTSVDLAGDFTALLHAGDVLLLEEMVSPVTGLVADADHAHRQVVRLTNVPSSPATDPITTQVYTRITWDNADALTFPMCLSARLPNNKLVTDVSVARGNLVLADHGRRITDPWYPDDPAAPGAQGISTGTRALRFLLQRGPLSFRISSPPPPDPTPVSTLMATDPTAATAEVRSLIVEKAGLPPQTDWTPLPDLLESGPFDHRFAVETDNEGRALLRFGDDVYGASPEDGFSIQAVYRIGVGVAGNVAEEALAHIIANAAFPPVTLVRNPIPAWGGTDPEATSRVQQLAPAAFRATQFRAVTEADYAVAAELDPVVAKAVARFRWTGSWLTVFLTIDPKGRTDLPPDLRQNVLDWVTRYTLAGYDLEIEAPVYLPLEIDIDVCVDLDHFRGDVQQALTDALSNRILINGTTGFFYPDNFTFGQPVYLSKLYAAIQAVEGVSSAHVRRFRRLDEIDPDPARPATTLNLDRGYISIGDLEVARCDNDPNFPENGTFRLNMLGGK